MTIILKCERCGELFKKETTCPSCEEKRKRIEEDDDYRTICA